MIIHSIYEFMLYTISTLDTVSWSCKKGFKVVNYPSLLHRLAAQAAGQGTENEAYGTDGGFRMAS